ncbi:hypothetical protein [Aquisalibacillus elongatus]|nr:hypothetical protein [Aquisalibacillus elongatus]
MKEVPIEDYFLLHRELATMDRFYLSILEKVCKVLDIGIQKLIEVE